MRTDLLEFPNTENENLRGIVTLPDKEITNAVICLHGFERCATTEKKFKTLADIFSRKTIATLRFDFSGCGLSDSDFKTTTIEKQWQEFLNAIQAFQNKTGIRKIDIVAHSLGACVLATQINKIREQIGKIILIAPALNQRDLLRYWFVTGQMKKTNPSIEITWKNYKDNLNEEDFLKDCQRDDKMTKANYISSWYFLSGKDFDFSDHFTWDNSNILHIHGEKDVAVPMESINVRFENQVVVRNGDHDLEKPDQMEQWIQKGADFLLKD